MMIRRIAAAFGFALLTAMLVFGVTGCESVAENVAEEATGVEVDQDGESVTIEGDEGENVTISGEEGEVPEDFPDDVPVYGGAVVGSSSFESGDVTNYTVTIQTKDAGSDVLDFYEEGLLDEGWEIEGRMDTSSGDGSTGVISAFKNETRQVGIEATESDGMTEIIVTANETAS